MNSLQRLAKLIVRKLVEGVEVRPDSTREKDRVLGNDGETSA
jgi:hypothetical protein